MNTANKTSPKISVIIPAYNVEEYIGAMLDCVLSQTMHDYEVIVINDGSTDGTGSIIADYKEKFPLFTCITQTNKGLSAARNAAMAVAKGEYCAFLDADDLITDDYLEKLYNACVQEQAELVKCSISDFTDAVESAWLVSDAGSRMLVFDNDLSCSAQNSPCAGIVSKSFLDRNNILFSVGEQMEDSPYGLAVNLLANKTAVVKESLYFHRVGRSQSIMTKVRQGREDPRIPYKGMRNTAELLKKNIPDLVDGSIAEFLVANTFACFLTTMYKNYGKTVRKELCSYCYSYFDEFFPDFYKNKYVLQRGTKLPVNLPLVQKTAVRLFAVSYRLHCLYCFSWCSAKILKILDAVSK